MIVLTSSDSYTISGRGLVKHVDAKMFPEVRNVRVGDLVRIDGKLHRVLGVEGMMKLTHPSLPGDNYGLVVEKISWVPS